MIAALTALVEAVLTAGVRWDRPMLGKAGSDLHVAFPTLVLILVVLGIVYLVVRIRRRG